MAETLTFRCPPVLRERIESFRQARGLANQSEAVKTAILEAAMEPEERNTVPDRPELLRLLAVEARGGSVTAMKTLLEEHRRDGDHSEQKPKLSVIDELAERRSA